MRRLVYEIIVLTVLVRISVALPIVNEQNSSTDSDINLIILHNNDMHAHFEQSDKFGGNCLEDDARQNNCYGGFARISAIVKQYRENAKNGGSPVLYLNAGDTYIGTPWFSSFKDKVTSDFMNILKPDAMVILSYKKKEIKK